MANAIYSNARAKALENRLLGKERLNRMLESGSAEEAMRILSEVNFGEGVTVESCLDFEKLIDAERKNLAEFIKETCASDAFKHFFLLKNDFYNAEAFIKSKYLKVNPDDMTVEDGLISKERLKEKIFVDDYKEFPEAMRRALSEIDYEFVMGRATGMSVDGIMKKALYSSLRRYAMKDKILFRIYSFKADCVNIALSLRSRDYSEAEKYYVEGGDLTKNNLKCLCEEAPETLREKCRHMPVSSAVLVAVEDFIANKPLSDFERIADSYAMSLLKEKKYSSDGILPYMLYCYYKSSEIDNVRIILVGLINGIEASEIKGRLRESYEG